MCLRVCVCVRWTTRLKVRSKATHPVGGALAITSELRTSGKSETHSRIPVIVFFRSEISKHAHC